MLSADLIRFTEWRPFTINSPGIIDITPNTIGVYAIRRSTIFGRFQGESDLCYIGCTTNSFRSRIYQYFHPGPTQLTNILINGKISNHALSLEISWKECENPREEENVLLQKYEADHGELPPFNGRH